MLATEAAKRRRLNVTAMVVEYYCGGRWRCCCAVRYERAVERLLVHLWKKK
jgi:hypothetical protein